MASGPLWEQHKIIVEDLRNSGAPDGAWLEKLSRTLNAHMEQARSAFSQKLEVERLTVEFKTAPEFVSVVPINGWTVASGYAIPTVHETVGGVVDLEGRIVPGSSGSVALQVPAAYLPDRAHRVPLAGSGLLTAAATIDTNGAITITYTGSPTYIDLGGLMWTAMGRRIVNSIWPVKVKTTIPGVKGVVVTKVEAKDGTKWAPSRATPFIDWHQDGQQLVIDSFNGLEDSTTYRATLLVFGDL